MQVSASGGQLEGHCISLNETVRRKYPTQILSSTYLSLKAQM